MAKTFAINTVPHQVTIGTTDVWFTPDVNGAEFLDRYEALQAVQASVPEGTNEVQSAKAVLKATIEFIAGFLEPESVPVFNDMKLPNRVVSQLVEHMAELYGGGREERPTTSSSGSVRRSGNPGKRG